MQHLSEMQTHHSMPEGFELPNLDEPIIPATPATNGVQAIVVGVVLLVFLPVVVNTQAP